MIYKFHAHSHLLPCYEFNRIIESDQVVHNLGNCMLLHVALPQSTEKRHIYPDEHYSNFPR